MSLSAAAQVQPPEAACPVLEASCLAKALSQAQAPRLVFSC